MKNKLKFMIIILILFIIILTVILAVILNNKSYLFVGEKGENIPSTDENVSEYNELNQINEKYEYFDTVDCVNRYINTLKSLNNEAYINQTMTKEEKEELEIYVEEQEEKLYNLLGNEYIEQFNITTNNISESFSKYKKTNIFNIENIKEIDLDNNLAINVIDAEIVYSNNKKENIEIIIKRDKSNLTFEVYPYEYIERNGNLNKAIEIIKKNSQTEIIDNYDNTYVSQVYDDIYICRYYFNIFKNNILSNPEYIYRKLDEKYRQKRFENLNEFNEYISNKQIENISLQLKEYLVQENSDNTISYVCKDQYGDLYIFNQSKIGQFNIQLDTYTIEQPKFVEEYTTAASQRKVVMNVEKFIQMINGKDYKAAYSVLDDDFKDNYFKTLDDFEKYIKNHFYLYNDFEYSTAQKKNGDIFENNLVIKNKLQNEQKTEFTILMKLLEGTDFVMSFTVK